MSETQYLHADNSDLEKFYLKQLVDNLPEFLFWKDRNSVFLGCNKNFALIAGLSNSSEIIGKTDYDLAWSKEESDAYRADDLMVMQSGQAKYNIEESQTTKAGEQITLLTNKVPLYDQSGNISGIVGIYSNITKLKNTQVKLQQEKIRAEAANRAKTEFLANMSHDVKTPMTGIVGVADLMVHNSDWCTPEKASMIHSAGLQVLSFFNHCLELSKLEMAEWDSKEEAFSLPLLLEEMRALFMPQAMSQKLNFQVDCDANFPAFFMGHRGSIYRIILNLVGNALKFTEKGEIQLRAFVADKISERIWLVGIEVKDTGMGIPEDKKEVIFEKLHRLTPAYEGKIEGSGIGLYIVDQYVKRMNGTINVDSILGEGSTFTVILPMTISASTAATPADNFSKDEKIHIKETPRILLVEDNPVVQIVTKNLLNDLGFEVDVAATGTEAIAAFSPGKYRLIYMDIGLPDIDGYAVTKAIRDKERTPHIDMIPIVALTGHAALDVQSFCGEVGMQGVISKPIQRHQIEGIWKRYGLGESINIDGLIVL